MKRTILNLLFLVAFTGGMQYATAQAPATAAPTPAHDPSDVVSLFSGHYTTVGKGPEIQSWGGNAVTKVKIAGTEDEMLCSSGGSSGIFTSGWKAQTKGYVHMDVYSVSGGAFSFGLGVTYGNTLTWLSNYVWPAIPAKQWTGIDIPVLEFVIAGLNDAVNVQTIRFNGNGTYYVDNIYAYGPKEEYIEPADIPVAPTPKHNSDEVKSVFSDSYVNSQKGITPQTFGGIVAKIMPYKSDLNSKVLELKGLVTSLCTIDTWKIADQGYIHLDVYHAGGGDGSFSFGMNASDWSGNNIKTPADYTWPDTQEGAWVSFDVPVSVFSAAGLSLNNITQIKFFGSGNFYVDNLYAYKNPLPVEPIEDPTGVPSFTISSDNVKSVFCEQYEEAGYQDSELGMTDVDSQGNMMFYGQNAEQEREFVEIVPGNTTIKLTKWNDYPFKIHKNSTTMDISDMKYLHISAYLKGHLDETNKPVTLTFYMHDNNGKKVDSPSNVAYVAMTPGQWVSISIPLCYYKDKIDLSNVYILRPRLGGYSSMDIYFDNIFAYKGDPIDGSLVAPDCVGVEPNEPIQDNSTGTLPPRTDAFLGVNLASASGGTVPGTLGTNYRYPKMEDLYYFNAKGVKLFRLPFRWKRIQSELGGPLVANDINAMKDVVREAERLGIWVMLDMHDFGEYNLNDTAFTVDGRYRTKISTGAWGPWKNGDGINHRDLRNDFADVWVKLAGEFKDFTNIWGYDLMNEPKDVDIVRLREGYQLIIDEVRKVDAKAAIVVEGKNYASSSGWPNLSDELKNLTDPVGNNIIYQAHTYFDNDNSGTYNEDYDTEISDFNVYKNRFIPFVNWCKDNGKKGMIGEFGVPYNGAEHSDPRYMVLIDSVFSYLRQQQMTATYWCGGAFYETNHITVQPAKDYFTEKSTMLIMDKYINNFYLPTGVSSQMADENISVYPNPVTEKLIINSKKIVKSIRISNLLGQIVYELKQENSSSQQYLVEMDQYPKGSYILQVQFETNRFYSQKIVKK